MDDNQGFDNEIFSLTKEEKDFIVQLIREAVENFNYELYIWETRCSGSSNYTTTQGCVDFLLHYTSQKSLALDLLKRFNIEDYR